MNDFLNILKSSPVEDKKTCLRRTQLTTLQVNMGNLCNQNCRHCHVGASPEGKKIMSREVADEVLGFLSRNKGLVLDVTGGTPELNPNFDYFIEQARPLTEEIIVRTNLTILLEPGKEYLPGFYKENKIHLIASLPCYTKDNVERQRGKGVFEKSIKAMEILNELSYAADENLKLDLVYNPLGANLPASFEKLQQDYKKNLLKNYNLNFNRLITIANVPIKRFKEYLEKRGEYEEYMKLLEDNFNPEIVENIMCRQYLSVGYDGKLYDCDFNQALGLALKDKNGRYLTIYNVNSKDLEERKIITGEHCLSCVAGYGSSCQGALEGQKSEIRNQRTEVRGQRTERDDNSVKEYYGKILNTKKDLKTDACCSTDSLPKNLRIIAKMIDKEILNKFYGCGSPMPAALENCTVLDLGCGTGRDVYICSYLVGEKGRVIGVDMTDEQLKIAKKHLNKQMEEFGYKKPNVEFKKGYIENLKDLDIEDNTVDVVISNCVINLSYNKEEVFREIFRVLKPGGELYSSDVFSGSRVPQELKNDPVLRGECLGGALYIEDFRRILRKVGCLDYRVVTKRRITLDNAEIEERAGMINFYSMTVRAFNLDDLEDICGDYGQIATYLGTIKDNPHQFILDGHHVFIKNKPMLVCGNTASMLSNTRYAEHFKVKGDRTTHFGPFECRPEFEKLENGSSSSDGACC